MDLTDRLLLHDAWTTRQLLRLSRSLTDDQLDREFDLGLRTLRATLAHIVRNVEAWSDCMAGRPIRERGGDAIDELIERHDRAAEDLVEVARDIAVRNAWDELWTDPAEDPPIPRTFGGSLGHVITHSMHHRAQVLFMLRRLGVEDVPEGDVLSWEAHAAGERES